MIDWYFVAVNSLWILGASIVLAALSWLDWVARETGARRRQLFTERPWPRPFTGGMVLVCLGLGLGGGLALWQHVLSGALAVWFGCEFIRARAVRPSSVQR